VTTAKEQGDILYGTWKRLVARLTEDQKARTGPVGPQAELEEEVAFYAQILGAKDPWAAVIWPEYLNEILNNTQPEWMESGEGLIF